jgi:regulatory protein
MPFGRNPSKPRALLNESALYDHALKTLGRAMRTEAELRRLLHQRAEPGPCGETAVASVLTRLKENGYLDDQSFAETYARLRQENEKLGQRNVRQKLQQKGVSAPIINETLEARFASTDEESLARQHLERKRISKPENEKETARVMRRLVAAGFSTGIIYKILRQWDIPDEALAALDSVDLEAEES